MKTPTILLVLDEPLDLQIYGTALRSLGYKVVLCGSRLAAIDLIESESVDFVIVSQGTPAFEGRDVLKRILQLHPKLPVLVVARALDVHCYFEAMELGAVDYLERPEPRDLLWTVKTQMPNLGSHMAAA
ncbi:MAG TPA: response regulator [Terriglobia bacterium]|nr:response regulator [Terriglobia bacterium]